MRVLLLSALVACGSSSVSDAGTDAPDYDGTATVTIVIIDEDASEPACKPVDACAE